ncbi:MAG: hypothetical protein H6Q10_2870 [Acidobacteria bacterium]|nr:hypothetical protein [Acidobacteriota bacterium]
MMAALAESGLLPAGFPQPGTMVRSPSPTEAGVVDVSCSPPEQDASGPGCIRLGPLSYVELGTIDYANARAYLFEVFLFDSPPLRPLKREAGYTLTRVVVHHPIFQADLPPVPGRHLGEVFDALQRGLLVAGARPIQVQ